MKNTSKILALVLVVMTVLMSLSVLNVSAVSSSESWVVAGSSGLCNGENWAATSTKNKMTWDAANTRFVMEYTNVKAGTYEFKCVKGGSAWYPGSNVKITVKTTGSTVRIYVSGSNSVTVKHEIIEPACTAHNPELVKTTATCTAAGTETYSCAACGEGFTANVAAYGHYYDENGQCIRCDKAVKLTRVYYKGSYSKPCCYTWDANNNPYVAWPGDAMKKDADGVWYYDIPEGYVNIIFNNNGSGQTGDLKTPTDPCKALYNSGWKEYHKDTVATEDATCTEAGSKVTTCSVCQRKLTEELPALGHNYVDGICSRCGHEDVCPHAETEPVPGKDATCEEPGLTAGEKCVACGEITKAQETIPALGHDWVDATFEAPKTCNNCGATEGKALVPVYFKPSKDWFADNANEFAAYFFNNGGNTWVKLTKVSEGVYVCAVPEGFTSVIFVRLNPSIGSNELSWDYSWGQTKDLTVPTNSNNMFVLDGKEWESGYWHPVEGHAEVTIPAVDATCTTAGNTAGVKCSICGTIITAPETIPALTHELVIETGKDATCTEAGLTDGEYCTRCDYKVDQQEIPAKGHVIVGRECTGCDLSLDTLTWWISEGAPYVVEGNNFKYNGAGDSYACVGNDDVVLFAKGHNALTLTITNNGSADSKVRVDLKGQTQVGEHNVINTNAVGGGAWTDLTYGGSMVVVPAGQSVTITVYFDESTDRGALTQLIIFVDSATWGDSALYSADVTLSDITFSTHTCSFSEPTCTEPGKCECGKTQGEALGHDLVVDAAVPAGCLTSGLTEGSHCSRCDYKVDQEVVPATGHDANFIALGLCTKCYTFNYWVVGDNAITVTDSHPLTTAGTPAPYEFRYIYITEAGHYVFYAGSEYTPATIFTTPVGADGKVDTSKYSFNVAWLEPGIYWVGVNFYLGVGDYTLNVSKVDCTINSVVTAPTCTEDGYTTHTCALCGHVVVDSEVAALGHDIVVDAAVEPTCTETGLTAGQHCSRCDAETVAQTEVPSLRHDWSEGNECSRCGAPKCEHEWVDEVTAPTCVADGYTTHTCSKCGENYKDTTVPATGSHTWVETVVAPTCTEAGSKTNTCSVCGETKTEEIPATGHFYVIGICQNPGCTDKLNMLQLGANTITVPQGMLGNYEFRYITITEAGWYQISCNNPLLITCIFIDNIYAEDSDFSIAEDGTLGESWNGEEDYGSLVYLEEGTYVVGLYYTFVSAPGDYTVNIDAHEHSYTEGKCVCGAEDPDYVPEDPGQQPGGDEPSEPSDPSDDPSDEPTTPAPQLSVWDKIVAFLKKILAMILGFFKK